MITTEGDNKPSKYKQGLTLQRRYEDKSFVILNGPAAMAEASPPKIEMVRVSSRQGSRIDRNNSQGSLNLTRRKPAPVETVEPIRKRKNVLRKSKNQTLDTS